MDAGGRASFEEFVSARSGALSRTALLLARDREHAQDLLQTALERTYRHWDRVSTIDAPEAYVRRTMANLLTDRWRRRRGVVELPIESAPPQGAPGGYSQVELRQALVQALRRLPPRMRAVLVLRYFEDMTEAEIATAMDCSVGTVKSQAARGLTKLRAMVGLDSGSPDTAWTERFERGI